MSGNERPPFVSAAGLTAAQTSRYSRQIILGDSFGAQAQAKLLKSRILVVGAGGLGCPAVLHLAGAGVGTIGVADGDRVELSNLHRQIAHTEKGALEQQLKTESLCGAARRLNSTDVTLVAHSTSVTRENALALISAYDLVIDATDNVATRYLLNDACVLLNRPLVSGAAVRFEGQLTVLHAKSRTTGELGPCYRCLHPTPPPPEAVGDCSSSGVLGTVPGIIGAWQALEAIKLASETGEPLTSHMVFFRALDSSIRKVRLRGRNSSCASCGDNPSITELLECYELFCRAPASDAMADTPQEILPAEAAGWEVAALWFAQNVRPVANSTRIHHVLLDVRTRAEFDACALDASVNIPLAEIPARLDEIRAMVSSPDSPEKLVPLYVICRRGNDSQYATIRLRAAGINSAFNIVGGLRAWNCNVDDSFPKY